MSSEYLLVNIPSEEEEEEEEEASSALKISDSFAPQSCPAPGVI